MVTRNGKQLDLNLLLVFEALMAERSVTNAAVSLGLTQSALSHSLARLRKMYGDPLFVRTPRGVQPTAQAQLIAEPLSRSLATIRATVEQRPSFDPLHETRTFRILMTDVGAIHFLPRLIGYLNKNAPGVAIETVQLPLDQYKAALQNGLVDLAVTLTLPAEGGLYQQSILEDQYVAVVAVGHPRMRRKPSLEQYLREQHVRVSLPGWTSHPIDEALRQAGVARKTQLTVSQYLTLPPILATTDLVATIPKSIFIAMRGYEDLSAFALPFEIAPLVVRQFWHERKHGDPGLAWLRQSISRLFRKSAQEVSQVEVI